jgi:hypothetical protein
MAAKINHHSNYYRCSLEKNQAGKQCVRIRARFARRKWESSVYFLAATFENAMRKLEQSIRFLQQNEERIWFWGVDRSDDPNFGEDILREAGLMLDRRAEFPEKHSTVFLEPDRPVAAMLLAPVRKTLQESRAGLRVASD